MGLLGDLLMGAGGGIIAVLIYSGILRLMRKGKKK